MKYEVVVTATARSQLEAAYERWATNRSASQSARWYSKFLDAIAGLSHDPARCPSSPESDRFPFDVRDLYFGVGSRPTHRAVFSIRGQQVLILAIRHLAQDEIQPGGA
jgi:plasmid stabilization system protein ParE